MTEASGSVLQAPSMSVLSHVAQELLLADDCRLGLEELMQANCCETQDFPPTLSSHQPGQTFLRNALLPSANFQPNTPSLCLSFH